MAAAPACRRAGGGDGWGHVQGAAVLRAMGPVVPSRLRDRLQTRVGWPGAPGAAWGVPPGGRAAPGPAARTRGQITSYSGTCGPWTRGALAASAPWPRPGWLPPRSPAASAGGGQGSRERKRPAQRGTVHAIEVRVEGWQVILVMAARTTIPWAATVVPIQAPAVRSRRALGTPARTHLAGHAGLHTGVLDRGCGEGVELWWRVQRGRTVVGPATDTRAVTVDARAQARGGSRAWEGAPGGPPTTRRGPLHRRARPPPLIQAVVVRTWHGRESGPAGPPVCLTNAAVEPPWRPGADAEARRLRAPGGRTVRPPPGRLTPPPPKTAPAVRGHVLVPRLRCARGHPRRTRRLAARATPAPGPEAGPRPRPGPGRRRERASGRVRAAGRGHPHRSASRARDTAAHRGPRPAPNAWLTLDPNLSSLPYFCQR